MTELQLQRDARIAWLTLHGPSTKNALTPALLETLIDRCDALRADARTRVVVLRGANGTFSAGADLMSFMARFQEGPPEVVADLGRRAAEALATLPQLTVAAIDGYCVGGGVVLAASCDLRWASSGAIFSIPELEVGIPLAWGGLARLVDLLGETRAVELVVSGRRFDQEEALRIGFVSATLADDLEARIATVTARPDGVLRTTKQQLMAMRAGTYDAKDDAAALIAALADSESQQAAQEYLAKRMSKKA